MVLVSESFPSDHNSVNNVRIQYRASLLDAGVELNCPTDLDSTNTLITSNFSTIDESTVEKEKLVICDTDFNDFLEKSKKHLVSSIGLNDNIKKVQSLVDRMTRSSMADVIASIDMAFKTNPKAIPSIHTLFSNDSPSTMDQSTDNLMFCCSAKTSRETMRPRSHRSHPMTQNPECVKLPMVSRISCSVASKPPKKEKKKSSKTPIQPRYLDVFKAIKNTDLPPVDVSSKIPPKQTQAARELFQSTSRYLDVFKNQSRTENSMNNSNYFYMPSPPPSPIRNTRMDTFYETHREPLTVPVVNIQLYGKQSK